jgi:beta-1,2-mannobiose phosphorylase / 1,2-beta-oligomannan phosphorylase
MEVKRQLILEPRDLWWEARGIFNPGVTQYEGKTYMLYRAVGRDNISRLGLAISADGESFERLDLPTIEGRELDPSERLGIEDPRIVKIDRDYYITYVAASVYPAGHSSPFASSLNTPGVPWRVRVAALRTRDFRNFERLGTVIPDLDTKDPALFNRKIQGKYWLLHRVVPSIFVSVSTNLKRWSGGYELLRSQESWEEVKIGAGAPPLETDRGWLLFYHGVDRHLTYRVGAALLDRENPAFVLKRTKQPLLSPIEPWEKHGHINNVVFVTGLVERQGTLYLYYGGGDKVIGLAKLSLDAVFESLTS